MAQVPRTRLEQHAQIAHLSVREFVDRFHHAAIECGEGKTHISERQAKRWLAGDSDMPRSVCCRILEHWWAEPVSRLLGPPDSGRIDVFVSAEELIVNAGRESVDHAIKAASALDPSALEHLHDAAQRAARAYYVTPPLVMLTDLVRLRDTVYEQLDRTHKPRQQAELYLLAGQFCGLLSSVSFDLGHPEVAEEQARAAHTYGNVIDHPSLRAWARALQVSVMFWTARPRRAASLAATALEAAPVGTARARLHSAHARSLALIGARQEVRAALDAAADELQRAGDDQFMDEIGGECGFDHSRRALCAGASFVALGDGEQAETEATTALALFGEVPERARWVAGELGTRVDLATARTLRGDLAGAEDALVAVFALDPERRTEAVVQRLTNLGRMLGSARYRDAVEADRIGEAIEHFTARSVPRSATRTIINPAG
ncbi:MAG TPA: hypothetical protein VJT72_02455 [Pseudonocardiaceae bacterium]|nr:hypothetical protein [Pseudonocardiaceae bacterium]